jgi:hypothetical protein
MKPNPYVLTFSDDADGGPAHVLWSLREFVVEFRKNDQHVAIGAIKDVEDDVVTISCWNHLSNLHDGPDRSLNIYTDFDEVRYL